MNSFESYLNRRSKYEDIFEKVEKCGINSGDNSFTKSSQVLNHFKFCVFPRNNISFINLDINYFHICKLLKGKGVKNYIDDTLCSYWKGDKKQTNYYEDFFQEKIATDCLNKKLIFIDINAVNYCIDRGEESNYASHAVCAILVPQDDTGDNTNDRYMSDYKLYYINPHGEVMKPYTYFEEYITRKRSKIYDFGKETVDYVVLKSIIDSCNESGTNIYYDNTNKYNYYGVNLQEQDNKGTCFIFPSIIYYNIGMYFNKKKLIKYKDKKIYLQAFKGLFENGQFNLAISSCFTDFSKGYEECVFKNINKNFDDGEIILKLIKRLDKSGIHFIKNICNTMINFICQEYFNKKIIQQ
jgi:hypothetical protein